MPLTDEEIERMAHLMSTVPTVDIKVSLSGSLMIDGREIIRNFTIKLGAEYLKVEVEMVRAIDRAEKKAVEKFIDRLAKMGIKVPNEQELFRREKLLPRT